MTCRTAVHSLSNLKTNLLKARMSYRVLLRKENIWKVGAGQSLTGHGPTAVDGLQLQPQSQPQPQEGQPVGAHPVDANLSAMLQNLLQDLAKDTEPHCASILQFAVKQWLSQVTLNHSLCTILFALLSQSSRALFLSPKR